MDDVFLTGFPIGVRGRFNIGPVGAVATEILNFLFF